MPTNEPGRERMLDPIERASEAIVGVLMAMTFTGSLSAATSGREEIRTMLVTALGCNVAWGLTDAVMYLVAAVVEKRRGVTLLGKYAGGRPWRYGLAIAVVGMVLVGIIMALGG
jgi:hypothetical protein